MTTTYIFNLGECKYYISEFKNDIIETTEKLIRKLIPDNNYGKVTSLLNENLGESLSSLEWIKKYPIKSVRKSSNDLEKTTIIYMQNYGINNIRSDLYKDVKLSDDIIESIKDSIKTFKKNMKTPSEPISERIKKIDFKINKLKKIFDTIPNNNIIINKYENFSLHYIINYYHGKDRTQEKYRITLDYLDQQNLIQQRQQQLTYNPNGDKKYRETQIRTNINLLLPNFKEIYEEIYGNYEEHFSEYFSDHKIVEEIANALLLKKKNEKLISKYGTLEKINEALSNMLYEKIDLINSLEMDDISESDENDDRKNDNKEERENDEEDQNDEEDIN